MNRRALLAMVHCAKKDLGLDDDVYRTVLERVTGRTSAAELDDRDLSRVVDAFRRQGWQPKAGSRGKRSEKPYVRFMWALWNQLVAAKVVRARAPRQALRAFIERLTGVTDPEWLTPEQGRVVIEALKAWQARVNAEGKP